MNQVEKGGLVIKATYYNRIGNEFTCLQGAGIYIVRFKYSKKSKNYGKSYEETFSDKHEANMFVKRFLSVPFNENGFVLKKDRKEGSAKSSGNYRKKGSGSAGYGRGAYGKKYAYGHM